MKHLFPVVLMSLGVLAATAADAQTPTPPGAGADVTLHALFDREWEWELTQDPLWASYLGDRRWSDQWPDLRSETLAARQVLEQRVNEWIAGKL